MFSLRQISKGANLTQKMIRNSKAQNFGAAVMRPSVEGGRIKVSDQL